MIIAQQQPPPRGSSHDRLIATENAWRAVGWFGLLLAFVGLADIVMVWYPMAFGNPTWEFGAVDMSFASLPLLTMGLAALLASAFARGTLMRLSFIGGFMLLLGLTLLGTYLVFYGLNIPLAIKATPPELKTAIWKTIAKTTTLGILFPAAYLAAGVAALRNAITLREKGRA